MATVSVMAGLVTRTWPCASPEGVKTIALTHHTISGSREVTIDGKEVPGSAGTNTALGGPATITFEIAGRKGILSISSNRKQFTYTCTVDGETLVEGNEALGTSSTAPHIVADVEGTELAVDADGKVVVWYRLRSTVSSDDEPARILVVHRRFKEFCALDDQLKSCYKGSTLLTSFPALPARGVKLFQDHTKPEFVDGRRRGLASYMSALCSIPRMTALKDFTQFVGLADDGLYERSCLFQEGPLGITLRGQRLGPNNFTDVIDFKANPDGSRGQAEIAGTIRIGDKLTKINGANCLGDVYEIVVAKLKAARRPMVIHFLGEYQAPPSRSAGTTAAAPSSSPKFASSSSSSALPASPSAATSAPLFYGSSSSSSSSAASSAPLFYGSSTSSAVSSASPVASAGAGNPFAPKPAAPAAASVIDDDLL